MKAVAETSRTNKLILCQVSSLCNSLFNIYRPKSYNILYIHIYIYIYIIYKCMYIYIYIYVCIIMYRVYNTVKPKCIKYLKQKALYFSVFVSLFGTLFKNLFHNSFQNFFSKNEHLNAFETDLYDMARNIVQNSKVTCQKTSNGLMRTTSQNHTKSQILLL